MSRSSAGHWTRPGSAPDPVERCWCASTGAGGTKETIEFLARRRVSYSVGFTLPEHTPQIYDTIPEAAWTPEYNTAGTHNAICRVEYGRMESGHPDTAAMLFILPIGGIVCHACLQTPRRRYAQPS